MARRTTLAAAVAAILGLASAETPPPAILPGGIVNAASQLPSSLRGGAIAAGARFLIPGVRMGPETAVQGDEANPPSSLAGVQVRIAKGDRAIDAGLLMVSATRIEAWMPASAPLGDVELTVVYEGRNSEPYKLQVVAASFGFYPAGAISAAPGDTVSLRGTGAGSLGVFVGGQPADNVNVSTSECCRGEERVSFKVPASAPPGCFVPVQALTNDGRASNTVAIAVHPPGQLCRDELDWFRQGVEQARNAGFAALAHVSIDMHLAEHAGARFQFDYGIASFGRQESGERQFPPLPPAGTCTLFTARLHLRQLLGQARSSDWTSMPEKTRGNRRLDAGEAISLNGPGGQKMLVRDARQQEYYAATLGGLAPFSREDPKPLYLNRGTYTVSSAGGRDIGPFTAKLEVTPAIVWKNRDRVGTIERDHGVTVEWKAGRATDDVIVLAVNADRATGDSAVCLCMAHAAGGSFTIPPIALGNLPETREDDDLSASFLGLLEVPVNPPARIDAKGLDAAFAAFVSASARLVRYH